jgi:hypothetical protein
MKIKDRAEYKSKPIPLAALKGETVLVAQEEGFEFEVFLCD